MSLIKDTTIRGKWWAPNKRGETPDEFFGELVYKKSDGIQLILEGSLFSTLNIFHAKRNIKIPVLNGISRNREYITLFNLVGNELGGNHYIYTEFNVEFAMLNREGYFADPQMPINIINFSTNFFHNFFGRKFVKSDFTKFKIQVDSNEDLSLDILDSKDLKLYFYFSRGFSGLGEEEVTIKQKIFLNTIYKSNVPVSSIIEKINYLRDFFTLLSFQVISYDSINVISHDENENQVRFVLLFKQQAKQIGVQIRPYEIFLTYDEMSNNFKDLLSKWIEKQEGYTNVLALYMQLAYLHFPSDIQLFLNIVFAIETLHNTLFNVEIFSNEELKQFKGEKKKALTDVFSEKFKSRINECFGHFASPSFSHRLQDLIARNKEVIDTYILDIDEFVRKVTRQRNYLAHNHSEKEKSTIGADEYHYYITILKLIFECNFLKELGYEKNQIKTIVKRNFDYDKLRKTAS